MAIPFLNNIDLTNNQLLNAKLQVTGTQPQSAPGQIYFDSSLDTALYHDNNNWVRLRDTTLTSGTFVSATGASSGGTLDYTVDLSATGTPDATKYLRGDNAWEPITAIPGTYTWSIQGDAGGPTAVASGDAIDFAGGTNVTTALSGTTLTINSTDTNDNDYLTALSFNTGDGVLTATVQNQSNVTVDLDGRYLTGNETITLTGEVTGSGTTAITTTVANGVLDVANFNASAIVIESEGIENNDNDTTLPTSAAVKAYVDASTVGGLIYQGGYDANLNSPDLTTSPNSILKGWTYTVTADGTFFTEQLRVGDVLIAEVDDPSALGDWTTVQNNIDLASLTQVGIGNVNAEPAGNLGGIAVSYNAGTAKVGLGIAALGVDPLTETPADYFIPIYNAADDENKKVASSDLLNAINSATSYATTITDTATISHGLASSDVMVQLYDITTGETVYADVDRISTTQVTITFATTPTNSVRVLVQKIG
jgi:hypothetical protein